MIAQARAPASSENLNRLSPADDKTGARQDLPSGLTLVFDAFEGGARMLIGGRMLLGGVRERLFDAQGSLVRVATYEGEWPPRWLARVV